MRVEAGGQEKAIPLIFKATPSITIRSGTESTPGYYFTSQTERLMGEAGVQHGPNALK